MPLNWLGQLGPTFQQRLALQEAMLALQRKDDELRRKSAEPQSALGRRIAGESPGSYAGPTSMLKEGESPLLPGPGSKGHFRPGAGSLEEALRAATPSPEGAVTAQGEAERRREEILEERVVSAKDAYDRLVGLSPEGQKIALHFHVVLPF